MCIHRGPIGSHQQDTMNFIGRSSVTALVCVAGSFAANTYAQQGDGTNVDIQTAVVKPAKIDATPDQISKLKAPDGFAVTTFATGLKNARILAVAPDGAIYVSRRDQGDVLLLKD